MRINKIVILSLLIIPMACGMPVKISGDATIHHEIGIDPTTLIKYFQELCKETEPDKVDECVNKNLGDFFRAFLKNVPNANN